MIFIRTFHGGWPMSAGIMARDTSGLTTEAGKLGWITTHQQGSQLFGRWDYRHQGTDFNNYIDWRSTVPNSSVVVVGYSAGAMAIAAMCPLPSVVCYVIYETGPIRVPKIDSTNGAPVIFLHNDCGLITRRGGEDQQRIAAESWYDACDGNMHHIEGVGRHAYLVPRRHGWDAGIDGELVDLIKKVIA